MKTQIEKVSIVGAGLIGASWAAFYASRQFKVTLCDSDVSALQHGRRTAAACLATLRDCGLLADESHDRAVDLITATDDLSASVEGAGLIQEAVTERYDVKQAVFRRLDQLADPQAVIASSSSGLLISKLQAVMENPGRSLIAHPFNPPHLIPLVELVPGERTDRQILAATAAFFESLGKVPVILQQEVPGHIANRLQAAVWREAIELVLRGVASVADVDKALSSGPGIRWALLGPHMIFHLAGGPAGIKHFIDHIGEGWQDLWKDMASWTSLPAGTTDALLAGLKDEAAGRSVEAIAQWRDDKLTRLVKEIYGS